MAPLTEEEQAERLTGIGASEMSILCGVNPGKKTPGDLYLWKTAELEEQEQSELMEAGHEIEPILCNRIIRHVKGNLRYEDVKAITEVPTLRHPTAPMLAHPDLAFICGPNSYGECKVTSLTDHWSDHVPDYVDIQCQTQMVCSDDPACEEIESVFVAALFAKYGAKFSKIYEVHRNDERCAQLVEIATLFWENHVVPRIPPDIPSTLETARRIMQDPKAPVVFLPAAIGDAYYAAAERKTKATKELDSFQSVIRCMAGKATIVEFVGNPGREIFLGERKRKVYTVEGTTYKDFKDRARTKR